MSIITQVRDIIADLDDKEFTVLDFSSIWEGMEGKLLASTRKSVGTCLINLKNRHKEVVVVGKGEQSKTNGKRVTLYKACEQPKIKHKSFGDDLPGWRLVFPELFGIHKVDKCSAL